MKETRRKARNLLNKMMRTRRFTNDEKKIAGVALMYGHALGVDEEELRRSCDDYGADELLKEFNDMLESLDE